ncbi:GIP [Symbiodinium sp. KB8]|nr:GIP [Symbiodinium sp. KB8]
MASAPGAGLGDDDGAAEPLDPWAEAARASFPRSGVDPPEVHGEDGSSARRAWRAARHSDENATGGPVDTAEGRGDAQDDAEPCSNEPYEPYDPNLHVWTEEWPNKGAWETSWNSGWETGWDAGYRRHSWSGATTSTSWDGYPWEGEWARLNSIDDGTWETEWTRETNGKPVLKILEMRFLTKAIGEEDLANECPSYIRQIDAWVRVTRTPPAQQALLLYQSLKGRAWIEAEELDVKDLCTADGVDKFKAWIAERYQEIEVGKIAEALNGFFKKLRRGPNQSVREFNAAFDRSYARLVEIECRLPETARAWAYLSALSLSHSEELAILGSVNNEFVCSRLQRAAVLHEKSLRRPWDQKDRIKPWERGNRVPVSGKVNSANAAEAIPEEEHESEEDDLANREPENAEEAELFEAFMTAKAQYRDAVKNRNLEPDEVRKAIDNKIQSAKQRSFCSVCKQRGHWYKDPECPGKPPHTKDNNVTQTANISNEVFMTSGPLSENLMAIADSACTKSVAGTAWLQRYLDVLKSFNVEVPLLQESDNFKFGASRIYSSSYAVVVSFRVGNFWVMVKVAIIHGDLPLLLSRSVLAELGMVYNLKEHKADFEAVSVKGHPLMTTPTGHPAISVHPGGQGIPDVAQPKMWDANKCIRGEVLIVPGLAAYMADCRGGAGVHIFYAKKIPPEVKNLLACENLSVECFVKWWNQTRLMSDFWIANRLGLNPSTRWTVEELRSAITEHKNLYKEENNLPKGLAGMRLDQLRTEAERIGLSYGSKTTRGTLIRHIRDYHETPDDTVMQIGRYKGNTFAQIPLQHAEWADREEKENGTNMSPDLKRFVLWYRKKTTEKHASKPTRRQMIEDPERYAKVPYPGSSTGSRSWEEVSAISKEEQDQRPNTKERMSVEVSPQVLEEIRALEQRLAVLKDKDEEEFHDDNNEGDSEQWSELDDDLVDAEVLLTEHVEKKLTKAIAEKDYTPATLTDILEEIFGANGEHFPRRGAKPRSRAMGPDDTGEHKIVLGYYTYGNMRGICANTSKFASLCLYIKGYFLDKDPSARWSSISLTLNCKPIVHADRNNLKGTLNYLTAVGDYVDGGGLWQEHRGGSTSRTTTMNDQKGRPITGNVLPARGTVVNFYADKLHSAEPWRTGNRWSITCFTTRGFAGSTQGERKRLRQWGFQLHDLRHLGRDRKHLLPAPVKGEEKSTATSSTRLPTNKPRKSTRKNLWRSASRASAFITWSLATLSSASASWVGNGNDGDQPNHHVALMEIGGINKTLEATLDFGCLAAEPLRWEDVPTESPGSYIIDASSRLRPSMIWLHPPTSLDVDCENKFFEIIDICGRWQVLQQRSFVVTIPAASQDQERRVLRQLESFGKVTRMEFNGTMVFRTTSTINEEVYVAEGGEDQAIPGGGGVVLEGAAGITFDKKVPPDMAAALRRLHQNLGHPAKEDLVRHLHHAGADRDVIKAAKSLECTTCSMSKRPKNARPAAEPKLLEFGDVVGVDMMYAYDTDGKKVKLFSMVDHASSYHVVVQVPRQTGAVLEKAFLNNWVQIFGAPKVITLDLERGIQDAFGRLADWYHVELRTSAGQAHWQSGFTERHGKWWKEIFDRVVRDHTVRNEEIEEAIGATSSAKNSLRRRCGWAPCQIVFGKNPRTDEDLSFEVEEGGGTLLRTPDAAQHRRETIRNAARIAFYQARTEDKIRRGMSQKSRVKPRGLENGSMVLFWRKPANKKSGFWKGPGTVIGRQEENYWISHGGRCYLCAAEHLRRALPEEVGGLFALRATKDDLLRLVENSYDDPALFPGDDIPEEDKEFLDQILEDLSMEENEDPSVEAVGMELENGDDEAERIPGTRRGAPAELQPRAVRRRYSTKKAEEVMILKRATTKRGREKQLEKEIPWSMIPEGKRQMFIEAEHKQWEEHLRLGALRPLSLEESAAKRDSGRVLTSRFAYRDKNLARRRADPSVEWKAKSRLVVSGHTDPDIISGALRTDSPTVSRTAVMCLLQIAASRLDANWGISAGDVTAAFLNGEKLERELYLKQPRYGLPGLHPDQLIKVEKGVFGLIDSPRKWWQKFRRDIQALTLTMPCGMRAKFFESALDPCVYQLIQVNDEGVRGDGQPLCYAAVHVDDILLAGSRATRDAVQEQLSKCFPVDEWEQDVFDFIGSHVQTREDGIFISQSSYAANRLFEVEINAKDSDDTPASAEQVADNRSLVGALSWLASQSRPDLACGVSMCQQLQAKPSIGDLRFSNLMARRALQHKDEGILLARVPLDEIVFTVFHDAGWSNAPDSNADPVYFLYSDDEQNGLIEEGPWVEKKRKTKKKNSSVASQLGALVLVHGRGALSGEVPSSILEWRSHACDRVCRSTFGAETMGCIEGIELAQYVRAMFFSFLFGKISREVGKDFPLLAVTDCRSLFDHMHKEGLPRTPSDRRLAIDIACLRQSLNDERPDVEDSRVPLIWVPTHLQRADVLTKPKKATDWWPSTGNLSLPLKEGKFVLKQCKSEVLLQSCAASSASSSICKQCFAGT